MGTIDSRSESRPVIIEKLVDGGQGLARTDDGVLLIDGVVPGETVTARVERAKRGVRFGTVARIIDASPDRVEPPCPLFGACGGCQWQHIAYPRQVCVKRSILEENLRRIGGFDEATVPVTDAVAGDEWNYRSRVQLHRSGSVVGYTRRASDEVIDVDACPVARPEINRWLRDRPDVPDRSRFTLWGAQNGLFMEGRDGTATTEVLKRPFSFAPGSFFQSNVPQFECLLGAVIEFLAAGETRYVIDLYAGCGVIGICVGESAERVFCVEPDRRNAAFVEGNSAAAPSVETFVGRAERFLQHQRWSAARWRQCAVVVDPPRTGLSGAVRAELLDRRPGRIAYISCDAAALSRDLKALSPSYTVDRCTVYDFYPQTGHIESLALLVCNG